MWETSNILDGQFLLHTAHCTHYTVDTAVQTVHCKLHTAQWTVSTVQRKICSWEYNMAPSFSCTHGRRGTGATKFHAWYWLEVSHCARFLPSFSVGIKWRSITLVNSRLNGCLSDRFWCRMDLTVNPLRKHSTSKTVYCGLWLLELGGQFGTQSVTDIQGKVS